MQATQPKPVGRAQQMVPRRTARFIWISDTDRFENNIQLTLNALRAIASEYGIGEICRNTRLDALVEELQKVTEIGIVRRRGYGLMKGTLLRQSGRALSERFFHARKSDFDFSQLSQCATTRSH